MEEKSSIKHEESREELLEELQKLRGEVNRLNDKLSHMEQLIDGQSQTEHTQAEYTESGQSPYNQPSHERFSYNQPSHERLSYNQPSHERLLYNQSPHDQSLYGQPSYRQIPYNQSVYDRPSYEQSMHRPRQGEQPVSRRRASVIPEMRRQRSERRAQRKIYQIGEMDVGKYGTAFLAAVCILAGGGLLMVSAWALADEMVQAFLMFGLGAGMTVCGWLLHQGGKSSAVPTTLAACGLGILYMDCVSLHFLWHLVSVEWVLPCILVWAVISFYMAFSGGTLLFYYVVNLGNLATAILVSSQGEGMMETWAGLFFTVAAYGFTLFQVFRMGTARAHGGGRLKTDGLDNTGMIAGAREAAAVVNVNTGTNGITGLGAAGETKTEHDDSGHAAERRLRWLKNFTSINVLAAYTILFTGEDNAAMLLFALLLGGLILAFWRDLYQGGAREEAAGVFFVACQMAVFCTRLTELADRWPGAAVCAVTLLLMLIPLVRARNRSMTAAWILYPLLWTGVGLSDLLTGSLYPVPYIILSAYYFYMLPRPDIYKIIAFVPAYIGMYLLLIGESGHPRKDITFALLMMFALGVPVKYLVSMMIGQSSGELFSETKFSEEQLPDNRKKFILSFRQTHRYGVAMLAAFVVCVTYCAGSEKPFVLVMEAAMLAVFSGMTLWMKNRDYRFFPILCVGMVLLWLMSLNVLEWCMGEGFALELAAGALFLLAGSLSAWCGIRYRGEQGWDVPEQLLFSGSPGISTEFMARRLKRYGRVFCPASLAMFSVSLYRLVLVFQIPYAIFVSLILLMAAVVILVLGFWLSSRSVRIYALFLMAVCVVKMVTADLAGTGWVYRAGALAGGGVLCMIVSFIYSRRQQDK